MLATFLQVLDSTIANVALPHMQASLGAAADTVTWVLTSYIVASAIATPLTGWLAGVFGRKPLFVFAIAGFIGTSMLCGLAQSLNQMVAFRLMQGRVRRVPGAARPVVPARRLPQGEARPGARFVGGRNHVRPGDGPGARRLADRQLRLALGVLCQRAVRPARAVRRNRVPAKHAGQAPPLRSVRIRGAVDRRRSAAADARPWPATRLVPVGRRSASRPGSRRQRSGCSASMSRPATTPFSTAA